MLVTKMLSDRIKFMSFNYIKESDDNRWFAVNAMKLLFCIEFIKYVDCQKAIYEKTLHIYT